MHVRWSVLHFLGLLSFLCLGSLHAQLDWSTEQVTWHYSKPNFGSNGYTVVSTGGDTLIRDRLCHVLEKRYEEYSFITNRITRGEFEPEYLNRVEAKIYRYEPLRDRFEILWDFGAGEGEAWTISNAYDNHSITRTILDTFYMTMGDVQLDAFAAIDSSWIFGISPEVDTFVRGVGPLRGYLRPWSYFESWVDGWGEGYSLLCFESESLKFQQHQDCTPLPSPLQWASPESVWTYTTTDETGSRVSKLNTRIEADSNGGLQITVYQSYLGERNGELVEVPPIPVFAFDYGDPTSYRLPNEDQTYRLYDFGASAGEQWTVKIPNAANGFAKEMLCEVLGTGRTQLAGFDARTWIIRYSTSRNEETISYIDTVAEGVGNLHGFLLPWVTLQELDSVRSHILRCFQNEEIFSNRPGIEDCEALILSASTDASPSWTCYPNPTAESITIEGLPEKRVRYELISIGGVLKQGTLETPSISLESVPPGLFLLQLYEYAGGPLGARRIVRL
ncbi:MAG: hypothetical protein KTR24_16975 [Saprospiraceae bacterium]|nr:hypothetical protein [Saprospiraceae bacterium]